MFYNLTEGIFEHNGAPKLKSLIATILAASLALFICIPRVQGQVLQKRKPDPLRDPFVLLDRLGTLINSEESLLTHLYDGEIASVFLEWGRMQRELPQKYTKPYEPCVQKMQEAYYHILISVDDYQMSEGMFKADGSSQIGKELRKESWAERDKGSELYRQARRCKYLAEDVVLGRRFEVFPPEGVSASDPRGQRQELERISKALIDAAAAYRKDVERGKGDIDSYSEKVMKLLKEWIEITKYDQKTKKP